jgi:hypothetical protein
VQKKLAAASFLEGDNVIFARDLQERFGVLALLALPAPFRIFNLQIPLAARETDPVSGYH